MTHFKKQLALVIILIISMIAGQHVAAQNTLSAQDLSTVNVDELSDDQIQSMVQRAQSAGMTQSQLEQQAAQRGMPNDQIQKLEDRINKLSSGTGNVKNKQPQQSAVTRPSRTLTGNQKNSTGRASDTDSVQKPNFNLVFDRIRTKIFGEDIFNNPNLTFEPNLRLATPMNYVVGIDDELLIEIYGYSEANYKTTVDAEGNIQIPNLGPVLVNGLTIEQARSKITNSLKSLYPGMRGAHQTTFVNINLGNIRSIKVIIIGDVKLPGTFTLPSLATVFNALYSSGGPDKNGSFRNIELIRNNRIIKVIDVYTFLMNGTQDGNLVLHDQDVIKVSPYVNRVEFRGEVKRPGIFEIKEGESLSQVLRYAGGFTDRAYTHRLKIIQNDTREKTVYDVPDVQFSSFHAHRGDLYLVETIINRFSNRIQITGAVFRPGTYALDNKLTLTQLIKKADGLREDAYTARATIYRLNEQLIPQLINFDVAKILSGADADILLQREDSIVISSRSKLQEKYYVIISGEVIKPDTVSWAGGMHLQDLVIQAGGFTDAASVKRIEVTRRLKDSDPLLKNAQISKVFRIDLPEGLRSFKDSQNFLIEPFDDVVVRTLPGYSVPQFATIQGEVLYGGKYAIKTKNQRVSDLITLAEGLTPQAFPEGATLIRQNANSRVERERRSRLLARLHSSPKDSVLITRDLYQQDSIMQKQAAPVGINLVKILKNPGSKYDLVLNDGDTIKIPQKVETVRISGDVLYPVRVRYDRSISLKEYVNSAGGFSVNAARKRTYVVYANGSVKGTSKFLFFNAYPVVLPGAQIFVPDKGVVRKTTLAEIIGLSSAITTIAVLLITVLKK